MNSLGKYVLTKTQKIVLLVVVFAMIAGGYYAGFYLPVQRRIEAADTAELDAQIQLENNRTAEQASGRYVLELEASGTGGMKKSLASNAYQTGTQTNYRTGQYPIVLYVSQADSDAEEEEVNLQDLLYRYR